MSDETDTASQDTSVLYEVFVRAKRGLDHIHAGSVSARSAEQALEYARDTYIRRAEGCSLWVVRSSDIHASQESDVEAFYDPMDDKPYRHATYYTVPDGVENL